LPYLNVMSQKKKYFLKSLVLYYSFFIFHFLYAQPEVTIRGRAVDRNGNATLVHIMVVNQRSGLGTFANSDGSFSMSFQRADTIMITARDCGIKKLCFRDSSARNRFTILVYLDSLHYELNEVYIHPTPTLPEIHKNIDNLGVQNTDTYKSADIMSPITLLYERFSRIEQSKRKVAEMENEQARRQVLKDLFHLYIKYDIINLSDKDFDDFIDFLHISDEFLKQSTDYELVMYIKQRYQRYLRDFGKEYYVK
jgi:hypothetical protein